DVSSRWLPELDSPKLSIALPPIDKDPEPSPQADAQPASFDANDDVAKQPSDAAVAIVAKDAAAEIPAPASDAPAASLDITSVSAASSNAADYYYHLDSLRSDSSAVLAAPSKSPSSLAISANDDDVQEDTFVPEPQDPVNMQNVLDHLGLDFDFATDPAIEDINATPLFTLPSSGNSGSQDKLMSHLDPESQQKRPVAAEPASSGIKTRVRRSSIASMLIRRTSKCFDSIGATAAIEAAVPKEQKVENQSQPEPEPEVEAKTETDAQSQSSSSEPAAGLANDCEEQAPVSSKAPAATEDAGTLPSYAAGNVDASKDPDAVGDANGADADADADADASPDADAVDAASVFVAKAHVQPAANQLTADQPNADQPTADSAAEDNPDNADTQVAEASSESFNAPSASDSVERNNSNVDPINDAPTAASLSFEANKPMPAATEPSSTYSIPMRRPPKARNLDRRSSRILDELSRKVQHVRQTTSMVLRRSVGSRLSVIPISPSEIPAAQSAESSSPQGSLPEKEQDTQQQQQDGDCPPSVAKKDVDDAEPSIAGSQDNVDNGHVSDTEKPVVAATTETSGQQRSGLSRRFTFVKRGTNEVVRNSVTRVKGIFASKKPVAV
ncbi:hypothetical protein FB639_004556, partial [Coemansia asiatica]